MKKTLLITLVASSLALSACSTDYTNSVSKTVDNRGTISFTTETREDAVVYLDGKNVGTVDDFIAGDDALVVTPGSHAISVVEDKKIVFQQKVFIGNSTNKVIPLP